MSAVILPFPCGRRDRARPSTQPAPKPAEGFAEPTLEGKVRAIGFRFCLNHIDRESLVALAKQWIGWGWTNERILLRAEDSARRRAAQMPDGPGAA